MAEIARITRQANPPAEVAPIPVQLDPRTETPVFGTAEPAHGLSRLLRLLAYRYPAYDSPRWLILLMADRLDATDEIIREALTRGQQGLVVRHFGRQVRAHPLGAFFTLALPVLAFVGWRWLRPARDAS
jgi:hypothetical protein